MPSIAFPVSETLLEMASELTGCDARDALNDTPYIIVNVLSPTEVNMKFVSEDELVEAVQNDAELQIISM